MSTLVGMQLNGRYRLDAQIGTGGMSTVYRAFDSVLERRVAVKLMHREIAADTDQLERFRREARAVAQLSHPHIVGVIDAGEEDGRPYIVFEYVEGETLKDRIRRMGRLPVDEAIAYAIEISRALGAAHARHIVHRDVKPQNVLIDEEGSAKVTDFGIARSLDEEGLTADGRVLGTTDYVSPEQALGHDVNGQSDIYSLGVVLFEMLTGDVPFHGENQVAVAMKHVREDLPDVQMRRPEVSAGLAAILDRMTDKHLEHRYPDAAHARGRPRGRARRRGRPLGPLDRRGHRGDRDAPRAHQAPPAAAHAPPLPRLRRDRRAGARQRAAAVLVHPGPGADRARHRRGQGQAAAGHEGRLGQAHLGAGLRPARRRRRARRQARLAVDKDPGTAWTTESYSGATLAGKKGVGLYVDAAPGVAATSIEIDTPKPGWQAEIQVAPDGDAPNGAPGEDDEWKEVGGGKVKRKRQRFKLRTDGKRYRYYLVWITKLPARRRARRDQRRLAVPQEARPRRRGCALGAVALEPVAQQAVADLGERHARRLPHLREAAGGGHAGQRVELVDEHAVLLDEEVDPRQPGAARAQERLARQPPHLLDHRVAHPRRDRRARRRPASTWPRSRTSRPPAGRPRPAARPRGRRAPSPSTRPRCPARTPRRSRARRARTPSPAPPSSSSSADDLRDPDRGAEPRRLDEHGQPERREPRAHGGGVLAPLAPRARPA